MSQLLPRANAGPPMGQHRSSSAAAAAAAWPCGGLKALVHRSVVQRSRRGCAAATSSRSNVKACKDPGWLVQGGLVCPATALDASVLVTLPAHLLFLLSISCMLPLFRTVATGCTFTRRTQHTHCCGAEVHQQQPQAAAKQRQQQPANQQQMPQQQQQHQQHQQKPPPSSSSSSCITTRCA
ncbi:hypothetical protein COO60DRAFT_1059538 [Scenedesmus sp. NREL 46B-D3]|nr:hypothetical protein COO60DRAFT_1059538 [Scenedesmus sp. NREL 46B-D3]